MKLIRILLVNPSTAVNLVGASVRRLTPTLVSTRFAWRFNQVGERSPWLAERKGGRTDGTEGERSPT